MRFSKPAHILWDTLRAVITDSFSFKYERKVLFSYPDDYPFIYLLIQYHLNRLKCTSDNAESWWPGKYLKIARNIISIAKLQYDNKAVKVVCCHIAKCPEANLE